MNKAKPGEIKSQIGQKMRLINTLSVILILATLQSCKSDDKTFSEGKKLSDYNNTDFVPTLENKISKDKNYVYCSTLLYAWNEVKNEIKKPLKIDTSLYDLSLLNNSKSYLGTLNKNEYTTDVEIGDELISARAEFKKSLPFELQLMSFDNELTFANQKVASFGVIGYDDKTDGIIQILYYKDDNNFILKLAPKDKAHEILLCMTQVAFAAMNDLVNDIKLKTGKGEFEKNQSDLDWKFHLTDSDEVVIPKINFNIETNYSTVEGKKFASNGIDYKIEKAWQRTAFVLNENGAEIESESEIVAKADSVAGEEKPKPKRMKFDKPFFLMLKRVDNANPYLALWVADTELLTIQ